MLYIGLDEAGYGPNLGPLVIGASLWSTPHKMDLYQSLADSVAATLDAGHERVTIADSKTIHASQQGISRLERQVQVCRRLVYAGPMPTRATAFMDEWDAAAAPSRQELPWYREWDRTIPLEVVPQEIESSAISFARSIQKAGVQLRAMRVRSLEPPIYNAQVATHGTKGRVLSVNTLELLREVLLAESTLEGEVSVVCDKHGGRNQYAALLQDVFELPVVRTLRESRDSSCYSFQWKHAMIQIEFRMKGESHLPTALASMCAKYQREIAMAAWNQFWMRRMPELRPTAGYPTDAKRFVAEISARLPQLKITQEQFWRSR